jgi:hypothetical protein
MANIIDHVKELLDKLKSFMFTIFSLSLIVTVIVLFWAHIGDLNKLYEEFLAQAKNLKLDKVEVAGFGTKISFSLDSISHVLEKESAADPTTRGQVEQVHATVHGMRQEEVVRLLNVGLLDYTCDYPHTTNNDVNKSYQLDLQLARLDLIEIKYNQDKLRSVTGEIHRKAVHGEPPANGYPSRCYDRELTQLGRNVATTLINSLSTAFSTHVALN